jgi:hypothetical protein
LEWAHFKLERAGDKWRIILDNFSIEDKKETDARIDVIYFLSLPTPLQNDLDRAPYIALARWADAPSY